MQNDVHFPDITLMITHYNRSNSLERLLRSFKNLKCTFGDIVVSDDASKPEHLEKVKLLSNEFSFRLVAATKNEGLGNNINKGQKAVKTGYTLYIQEDFIPTLHLAVHLKDALDIMNENKKWDYIRFYSYWPYPYLKEYKKVFFEMFYKPWYLNTRKFYCYTDHPMSEEATFSISLENMKKVKELTKPNIICALFYTKKSTFL
jgi:GT2 family glycosyltransferase